MAAKKRKSKKPETPSVSPSERAAAERRARTQASASSMADALQNAASPKPKAKANKVIRAPKPSASERKAAEDTASARSRARMERAANTADFLNDWLVDTRGNILGQDEDHELTRLIKTDPESASRVLQDYNLKDLPDEFADLAFGPGYVPAQYNKKGEKVSDAAIQDIVSIERGIGQDVESASEDYDPSQDVDQGSASRRRESGFDLGNVLGKEGFTDINAAQQSLDTEEDRLMARYSGVRAGLGPLTRGRIATSKPASGAYIEAGATNRPQTVVPRRNRLLTPQEIDAAIEAVGPTKNVEERKLVDPRSVEIVMSSRGDVEVPVVSEEEAARATAADKQSILSRDDVFRLANEGNLASPTASNRVSAMVQVPRRISPDELATPDVPSKTGYTELGVQSVGSAREEARKQNKERLHLGTVIAKLSDAEQRAGLVYRRKPISESETRTMEVGEGTAAGKTSVKIPVTRTVFEGTTVRNPVEESATESGALSPETIRAIQAAGYGGLFGGSFSKTARIGRPQGQPLTATRGDRNVSYNVDQFGNINETDTDTGSTTVRPDISVQRQAHEAPDAPISDADLELKNPLDTGTVNPMSDDYTPKTLLGMKWEDVADNPEQVEDIKKWQAEQLAKGIEKNPDTPQSLLEARTTFPKGAKNIRGSITENKELEEPTLTSIKMAEKGTDVSGLETGTDKTIKQLSEEHGMSEDEVVEVLSKSQGLARFVEDLARPSGVSAYKERIFEATTVPGGRPSTLFPRQRATIKTNRGRTTSVEVTVPSAETLNEVLDTFGGDIKINSPEEKKLINKLGMINPETGKLSFHRPTVRETREWNARRKAERVARTERVAADAAKAAAARLGTPRPADVEGAKAWDEYTDIRSGENARYDVLGQIDQHLNELAMYSAVNSGSKFTNPNVVSPMPAAAEGSSAANVNAAKLRTTGKAATTFDLQHHELLRSKLPQSMLYNKTAPTEAQKATSKGNLGGGGPKMERISKGEEDALIMAGAADEPNEGAWGTAAFSQMTPPRFMRGTPEASGVGPQYSGGKLQSVQFGSPEMFERSERSGNPTSLSHDPTEGARGTIKPLITPVAPKPPKESKGKKKNK
jgi:hypothetical protein